MALPVALQVYSVRDEMAKDFAGTLKKVGEMGYDGVEFAGLGSHSASEVRKMLDDAGLKGVSAHVPYEAMEADVDKVISDYKTLGCKYIAIPWLDLKRAPGGEDFESMIDPILQIGKAAKAAGLQLLYHNHDFEFRKIGDAYGLDVLYDSVPAEFLGTEIDTCWVKVSKLDPAAYVRKYKGRAPIVHLKDFVMGDNVTGNLYELIGDDNTDTNTGSKGFEFKPLGQGVQNIPEILEASLYAGAQWVVVEQDMSNDIPPLEAVKQSREYLKTLGW